MADDTAHRPGRGIRLQEIQRHLGTEPYSPLHVQKRNSYGQCGDGSDKRLAAELFTDFHVTGKENIEREIEEYIKFFNEERPAYALGYMTPKQYKEAYSGNGSFRSRT